MAASILEHQEDKGVLSIFAAGNTLVVACENGHYWVLETQQENRDSVGLAVEARLPAIEAAPLIEAALAFESDLPR